MAEEASSYSTQIVQCGGIKTTEAKIRRARLEKRGRWRSLPSPRTFFAFLLLNDFAPLSRSLEPAIIQCTSIS